MLEDAIVLIKAGEIEKARPLLIEFLKQNLNNEDGWLWMTRCVTKPEQIRYCFEKVLKINPQNPYAIKGLERLNNPTPSPSVPTPKVDETITTRPTEKKGTNKRLNTAIAVGLGITTILFLYVCGFLSTRLSGSSSIAVPAQDKGGGSTVAYVMCQQFIEKSLVAPAAAKWPRPSEIEINTVEGKKDAFQIKGYVDGELRMSDLTRNNYVCEISYVGKDQWHLDYLNFNE